MRRWVFPSRFTPEDPLWTAGSIDFFLTTLSFGWLGLATLGVLHADLETRETPQPRRASWAIILATPPLFALGLPARIVPEPLRWTGMFAGIIAGSGWLYHGWQLWIAARRDNNARWRLPLFFLFVVGTGQLLYILPPITRLAADPGMKTLYLHTLFLGLVSLALIELIRRIRPKELKPATIAFQVSVLVLLATLSPTTILWPQTLSGTASLYAVAVGSLAPTVAAGWLVYDFRKVERG